MNQTQTFWYRSIKQNHKVVKKMFSYHFDMHLFRANTFLCRPNSQTQRFRYRSIKQNKRICYRLSKQNKTTLRTMSLNFLESTDPSTGNVCFFRFGTMSFKLSQPAIPYNDSCLASKTRIPASGNRQFLAMVTSGSQVGNRKFQGLGTGSSLPW